MSDFTSFTSCPERLFEFHFTPFVFTVYLVLKSYDFGKGVVWPSVPTIAKKANVSERTVRDALRELERVGLITTERRANKSSRYLMRDIEDVPLPAALENPEALTSGSAGGAGLDRQEMPVQGGRSCRSGSAGAAAEEDKDKRRRPSTEKQNKKPDQPSPAFGGGETAARDPQGKTPGQPQSERSLEREILGAVSSPKQIPPPSSDFSALRARLEKHT